MRRCLLSKQVLKNRLIERGNSQNFVDGFEERFENIEKKFYNFDNKIYIKKNEFLEDALKREGFLK